MAARIFHEICSAVQRRCGGGVPMGEVMEAVSDANKRLHTDYEWPWSFSDLNNIQLQAIYTTGTVSINDGTNSVSLTGGTWSSSWVYRRILLGNVDYRVQAFTASTATLYQNIGQGVNFVNSPYTVFQDLYPLPTDCDFGNILVMMNPTYRYRLRYLPRYTLEWQSVFPRIFNNIQTGYADAGFDDTTSFGLLRFAPPPGATQELKFVYRRRPPEFGTVGNNPLLQRSLLPESFDDILILFATYLVKSNRSMPGWMEAKTETYQRVRAMRRRISTVGYDNYSTYLAWPYYDGSSVQAGGLSIGITTGSYP